MTKKIIITLLNTNYVMFEIYLLGALTRLKSISGREEDLQLFPTHMRTTGSI